MTWQTIFYFTSILLTCALSAFLAVYAWKHRQVPGSRTFAGLALSECLWALAEILSVLSPSAAWALFWFEVRYLFGALIGVCWFVFALEYNGRQVWLSKRLLTGLFVVPLITQALLWSNQLHGLWARQEVSFDQNGPLWIADTASRLPGLGYLTHAFYILLLTLAGIILLLLSAWKLRREFIAQALLLAGAGLTAFFFLINSLFNLLPKMEFNPFTPGLGLSLLLIALAVFRFEFITRAPVPGSAPRLTGLLEPERRSLALLLLIFLLLVSGIFASAYLSYVNHERQFRAQVDQQLSAVVELKVAGLQDWRAEHLGNGEVLYQNPVFAALVQAYLENPAETQTGVDLQAWFDSLYVTYPYERVFLLDTNGLERLASPKTPEPLAAHLAEDAAMALAAGQVTFIDFHREAAGNKIYLTVLVPIFSVDAARQPLGVVVLRINPETSLYPYLQQWPATSESAETLLVRREGESALFLNPLRFKPDAALNLRYPLTETDILAVMAVLGQTGVVDGRDYRGEAVIGALAPVPGTPWLLVARMDASEGYAPLRERLWQTVLFFGIIILVSGAGLIIVWRQQRMRFYKERYEASESLRESEERFRAIFEQAAVGVAQVGLDGRWLRVNQRLCDIVGYTNEELLSLTSQDITHPDDLNTDLDYVRQVLAGEIQTYAMEKRYIRKDRSHVWINLTVSLVCEEAAASKYFVSVSEDISERKQAEEQLRRSEADLKQAQQVAHVGSWAWHIQENRLEWSDEMYWIFGIQKEEFNETLSDVLARAIHPEDRAAVEQSNRSVMEDRKPIPLEYRIVWPNGFVRTVWAEAGELILDAAGNPVSITGIVQDITERKQVEEALRDSEEKFRQAFNTSPIAISIARLKGGGFVSVNKSFEQMSGYSESEVIGKTAEGLNLWKSPQVHQGLLKELRDKGEVRDYETPILTRNGEMYCLTSASLVEINGEPHILTLAIDITERKRAEDERRVALIKYKTLFDCFPQGITVSDEAGNILETNSAAVRLLGVPHEEHTLRGIGGAEWKIVRPDGTPMRPEELASIKALKEKRVIENVEMGIVKADNSITWISVNAAPLPVEGYGVVVTYGNISERKWAEERLAVSEVRYRRLFEAARDGILILDAATGIIVDVNPFLVEMLGVRREEICGKELWELGFFKDIAENKANFLELQLKEYIRYEDLPLETANGQRFNVEFVSNVYQVNHHRVVQCNIRDVTERKLAESLILQERNFNQAAINSLPGLFYLFDEQGQYLRWNKNYEQVSGYSGEEIARMSPLDFFNEPDKSNIAAAIQQVFTTGEVFVEGNFVSKNQIQCPYFFTGQLFWFEGKRCLIGMGIDITERKLAEQRLAAYSTNLAEMVAARTHELRAAQERLLRQERLATLGQVAGSIAHELRNPLGVISNATYYLNLIQPQAEARVQEYLAIIENETRLAEKIITDLLDHSRIKLPDRHPIAIADLLQRALDRYPLAPKVHLILDLPAELPPVYLDPGQIVQVLGNLLTNAYQAMPDGGNLTVSARLDEQHAAISVTDSGVGIAPENMPRLFEPLFTTKLKGIGLGLSLSKTLVEANDGRIEVQSEVGQGSTFTMIFPALIF